jgi:threonine/homoserine/homoserine lactone efflux protein
VEYYLAVITFTFVGAVTPGPNNIMLMASGLNHGLRKSVPHYLGISFGFPVMVAAVGLGMGAVFTRYPYLHRLIAWVGIGYLLFLAWKVANAGNPHAAGKIRAPLTFLQAASFQWVNPKAWVIATGAIAAFTRPGLVVESIAFIVLSYLLAGLLAMGLWLKLGQSLQAFLHGTRIRHFNIAMGVLLVLSVVPVLFSEVQS